MSVVVESERQDSAHMAGDRPREVTEYPLTEAAEAAPVLLTLSKRSVFSRAYFLRAAGSIEQGQGQGRIFPQVLRGPLLLPPGLLPTIWILLFPPAGKGTRGQGRERSRGSLKTWLEHKVEPRTAGSCHCRIQKLTQGT